MFCRDERCFSGLRRRSIVEGCYVRGIEQIEGRVVRCDLCRDREATFQDG